MKVAGFFAGVGGIELGFEQNDFDIVWSNEIDQKASETFKANHSSKIVIEERNGIDYIERYVNPKDPALYIRELDKRCKEKIEMFRKEKIN